MGRPTELMESLWVLLGSFDQEEIIDFTLDKLRLRQDVFIAKGVDDLKAMCEDFFEIDIEKAQKEQSLGESQ